MTRRDQAERERDAVLRALSGFGLLDVASTDPPLPDIRGRLADGRVVGVEVVRATNHDREQESDAFAMLTSAIETALAGLAVQVDVLVPTGFRRGLRGQLVTWLPSAARALFDTGRDQDEYVQPSLLQLREMTLGQGLPWEDDDDVEPDTRKLPESVRGALRVRIRRAAALLVVPGLGPTFSYGDATADPVEDAISSKEPSAAAYRAAQGAGVQLWLLIVIPQSWGAPAPVRSLEVVADDIARSDLFDRTFVWREETGEVVELLRERGATSSEDG